MTGPDILVPYDEYITPEQVEALVDALRKQEQLEQYVREHRADGSSSWLMLRMEAYDMRQAALAPFNDKPLPMEEE